MARRRCTEWLGRVALAIAAPVLLLLGLEAASYVAVGRVDYPLPGVAEAARHLFFHMPERVSPLFSVDGDEVVAGFETSTHFLVRAQRFPARRSDDAVRIAFLGGSSVQGWPFREPGASFGDVTGELLQARFPDPWPGPSQTWWRDGPRLRRIGSAAPTRLRPSSRWPWRRRRGSDAWA